MELFRRERFSSVVWDGGCGFPIVGELGTGLSARVNMRLLRLGEMKARVFFFFLPLMVFLFFLSSFLSPRVSK